MKHQKLFAALLAVSSAFTPFGSSVSVMPEIPAAGINVPAPLPEWIPTDFDAALAFRNTYGATRVEDGFICVVFEEQALQLSENEPHGVLRYEPVSTKDLTLKRYDQIFMREQSPYWYQVLVYDPTAAGTFEVALVDTWLKADSSLDLGYSKAVAQYMFDIDRDLSVTETDIYGWLPDCLTEYEEYVKQNGRLSVHDNNVVFALESVAGTAYTWEEASQSYTDYFALLSRVSCSKRYEIERAGGAVRELMVYQARRDGYAKIEWEYGPFLSSGEPKETLTADCIILDNAQTVLLADTARIRFFDANSEKLMDIPDNENPIPLSPRIAYKTADEGVYAYPDLMLTADCNPFFWDFSQYRNADVFEIDLDESALPEGYTLPTQYRQVKTYENGAQDVLFFLTAASVSEQYQAEITLLNSDTGELLPITSETEFTLCDRQGSVFDTDQTVVAKITANPCSLRDLPCDIMELILKYPRYYRADDTNAGQNRFCTVRRDDQGVSHVTYRLRFVPTGDINGDLRFYADDIEEMQKWLIGDPTAKAVSWKAADYNNDNRLDARDFTLMKRDFLAKTQVPVAVSITETGGYDGIILEWNVWEEDGRYLLSRWDRKSRYVNGEPVQNEKATVEITEADYRMVMDMDFHRMIEEYYAKEHLPIMDGIDYKTILTFADGSTRETAADMSSVIFRLMDYGYFDS